MTSLDFNALITALSVELGLTERVLCMTLMEF